MILLQRPVMWLFSLAVALSAYIAISEPNWSWALAAVLFLYAAVAKARMILSGKTSEISLAQARALRIFRWSLTAAAFVVVPVWWFLFASGKVEFQGGEFAGLAVHYLVVFVAVMWILEAASRFHTRS